MILHGLCVYPVYIATLVAVVDWIYDLPIGILACIPAMLLLSTTDLDPLIL